MIELLLEREDYDKLIKKYSIKIEIKGLHLVLTSKLKMGNFWVKMLAERMSTFLTIIII